MQKPQEVEVYFGRGISGTIAIPHGAEQTDASKNFPPASHKVALILHGQGGHRNYCYQKQLAYRLAEQLGIYSLRIDFRGCGSSADNVDSRVGRVLAQDVADIQDSAEFLIDGTKNPLGINFTLSSIISHSRGGVAMFLWALEQDKLAKSNDSSKAIQVPNLVNCSSRYQSETVYDRYPLQDEDFDRLPQMMLRHGKYQEVLIMRRELLDLAEADLSGIKQLPPLISVLSVYGLEDNIIPIVDSAHFANQLNRGHLTHQLELIPLADHNFFGTVPIENDDDQEEYNPQGYPLNSSNLVNYNPCVVDKIIDFLQPHKELQRFLHASTTIGQLTRWKRVEGVSNFRDIGGWRITNPRFPKGNSGKFYIKPNILFRSAHLGKITNNGLTHLKQLGIKVIFDLRSDGESERDGFPSVETLNQYGIQRVTAPVFSKEDYSPQAVVVRYTNLMTSWSTYVNVYDDMLTNGAQAFRTILTYIKDHKHTPILFHCTAGKDRTGVLSMIILLLVGLDKHTIAKEYELTTIGLIPEHQDIKKNFINIMGKMKSRLGESKEIENTIGQGRENWTLENDGFNNLISSRHEAMLSTIELVNGKYGGVIGYLKHYLKFTETDIGQIYDNLIVNDSVGYFRDDTFMTWSANEGIDCLGPNL